MNMFIQTTPVIVLEEKSEVISFTILWHLSNEGHQLNGRFPTLPQKGTLTYMIIIVFSEAKGNFITISLESYTKYS